MPGIVIIDYGFGNVRSVQRVFARIGREATASADPAAIANADLAVLPGVGAFKDAIAALRSTGMDVALTRRAATKRPILGICLGMQLLASRSLEDGVHQGLDLIPGAVEPIPAAQHGLRLPHIGWNEVLDEGADAIFSGLELNRDFYFVHSYHFVCADSRHVATKCSYGIDFCCAVRNDNIFGLQFHPEKSQDNGRAVLTNILRIVEHNATATA